VAEFARSTAERAERTRERGAVSGRRDQTARDRDKVADHRDANSLLRDQIAQAREEESEFADSSEALADAGAVEIDEIRARAAFARTRAATDRLRATHDREQAAADRAQAAEDRAQAAYDREHAGTDELTGVRRRGVGLEDLANEMARSRRQREPLVAVYVDVDGLKAVNDSEGHPAGDKVLQVVASRLRGQMRSYDLIIRLGGDEFLCVLPGVAADKVRERFARLKEPADGHAAVSVGLTELQDDDGVQELISRADDDLIATRAR